MIHDARLARHPAKGWDMAWRAASAKRWVRRGTRRPKSNDPIGLAGHHFPAMLTGTRNVPESSDTLEEVLAHLNTMVEEGILTAKERARSEAFYKRLFSR